MMETKGLGAGSYPEPKETMKCFNFTLSISGKMAGYVYAKNELEAKRFIYAEATEECDLIDYDIEEIESLEED